MPRTAGDLRLRRGRARYIMFFYVYRSNNINKTTRSVSSKNHFVSKQNRLKERVQGGRDEQKQGAKCAISTFDL
jgi:hypothetical protein